MRGLAVVCLRRRAGRHRRALAHPRGHAGPAAPTAASSLALGQACLLLVRGRVAGVRRGPTGVPTPRPPPLVAGTRRTGAALRRQSWSRGQAWPRAEGRVGAAGWRVEHSGICRSSTQRGAPVGLPCRLNLNQVNLPPVEPWTQLAAAGRGLPAASAGGRASTRRGCSDLPPRLRSRRLARWDHAGGGQRRSNAPLRWRRRGLKGGEQLAA